MKKICTGLMFFILTAFMAAPPAWAGEPSRFKPSHSYQGFTGLINTPNAEVIPTGRMSFTYSNQLVRQGLGKDSVEDYKVSFGFLPYLEFGGRLVEEHPDGYRDFSFNMKLQVPFLDRVKYLPHLAFGVQDPGGGNPVYNANYVVLSKEIGPVRLSLGWGDGDRTLSGFFGGAEIRVMEWLYLIGEYDSHDTNLGVRLSTPEGLLMGLPVSAEATAKTTLDSNRLDVALTLSMPLGSDHRAEKPLSRPLPALGGEEEAGLAVLKKALVSQGFENVRVGLKGGSTVYVEYENNVFNVNKIDGLGVVLGLAATHAPTNATRFLVVAREMDLPMISVAGSIKEYRAFLSDPAAQMDGAPAADELLTVKQVAGVRALRKDVRFSGSRANASWLKPRLTLHPSLINYVGSDYGMFEYYLSLAPEAQVNLWPGAAVNATWNVPLFGSEKFDSDWWLKRQKPESEMTSLMFMQGLRIAPWLTTLVGAGTFWTNYTAYFAQAYVTPGRGAHRLGLQYVYMDHKKKGRDSLESYLGTYRFYLDRLDLALEGTAGQFIYGDRGWRVDLKKWFGDTFIGLFYKQSTMEARAGGFYISVPLSTRKDMKPTLIQVRPTERWTYELQTKIVEDGERNIIDNRTGVIPGPAHSLKRSYFNHDRMSALYIRAHLLRLRDAYLKYGLD